MSVEKRDILAPSAIEPYDNSVYQSAEDLHCTEPSSAGANGDSTAHGDVAGWGRSLCSSRQGSEHRRRSRIRAVNEKGLGTMATDNVSNTASPNVDLNDYGNAKAKYCHGGIEHQGAEGIGIAGEDHFVTRSGGGDDVQDTGQQPGKSLL